MGVLWKAIKTVILYFGFGIMLSILVLNIMYLARYWSLNKTQFNCSILPEYTYEILL